MGYLNLNEFLFAFLFCYSFIVVTSGMSHPPLIVAPDPNANSVFFKKAELVPAATGTHTSGGKNVNHGDSKAYNSGGKKANHDDGKAYNSGKVVGEGYHKKAGHEENIGYQKKDRGNFGIQGTSGFSKSGGTNYGGGHFKANTEGAFKALGGKSHAGADGASYHDAHQDRDKKFKEFMASLQADNSFNSFSHGDQKSYGDSYDNIEGFHKGDKGSFSESDGYDVKKGHDNSGGEKFVQKGKYNDEHDHNEGKFGNAKYGEHQHKSGHNEGHKSVQGQKGGSSDRYNQKSGHGNIRGHSDHAEHQGHHSSAHKDGHGSSHNNGNTHHSNNQGINHHGKHHSGGHGKGKQGEHKHEINQVYPQNSGYQAGSGAHHRHIGGHQSSNTANHVPILPVYYPYLTPPGTTAVPHLLITAIHSGKPSEDESSLPSKGHIQTLANTGVAVSHLGIPAGSIIVHDGGIVQHGTHLGLPRSSLEESAQDSQIQPILATVDDNIVSGSVVHSTYEGGTEEAGTEAEYENENEGQELNEQHSKSTARDDNGEEKIESSRVGGASSIMETESDPSKESTLISKTTESNSGSIPIKKGIENGHDQVGISHALTGYEPRINGKSAKQQIKSENARNEERKSSQPQNEEIHEEYETEMSSKIKGNTQEEDFSNGEHSFVNDGVLSQGSFSNSGVKDFKDVHSTSGRSGTPSFSHDKKDQKVQEEKGSETKEIPLNSKQAVLNEKHTNAKNNEGLQMNTEEHEAQNESHVNEKSEMESQQGPHISKQETNEATISQEKADSKYVKSSNEMALDEESQLESSSNQNKNTDYEPNNNEQMEQEAENEEVSEMSESIP